MTRIVFLFLLLWLFTACEKNPPSETGDPKPADQILSELENAYTANSLEQYRAILDDWAAESVAKPDKSLGTAVEKDIYEIFQILYNPFDISRLGEHEWGELYEGYDYVVVQNRVDFNYAYADEYEYDWEQKDSIMDFRPQLSFPGKTVLYLSANYHEALYNFLGIEFNPLGTGGIMNPAQPAGDSYERLQFLHNYLAVIPGHWGGYYHIETHPEVSIILFNKELTRAKASFRVGYMFGDAEFKKILGKWGIISSSITGIEK